MVLREVALDAVYDLRDVSLCINLVDSPLVFAVWGEEAVPSSREDLSSLLFGLTDKPFISL
jgi:hypothetical protein